MRYYLTQRPVMIGGFPRPKEGNRITEIVDFDSMHYCKDIGRNAWGYIEYEQALSPEDIRDYELIEVSR